jgi:hypothetical protein
MRSAPCRQWSVAGAAALLLGGCNALWGLGDLRYRAGAGGAAGGGHDGGSGALGGSTGTSSGGGTGGASGGCDPALCPGPDGDCVHAACANNQCTHLVEPAGDPCDEGNGHYCDGNGSCVECLEDGHCSEGTCVANKCYQPNCIDGIKNGTETDIDCGGACAPCDNGKSCDAAFDCLSWICEAAKCKPCLAQAECPASRYCDLGSSFCVLKKPKGAACASDYECISAKCAVPDQKCS